eukprot:5467692-Amphidinium_carterae.1
MRRTAGYQVFGLGPAIETSNMTNLCLLFHSSMTRTEQQNRWPSKGSCPAAPSCTNLSVAHQPLHSRLLELLGIATNDCAALRLVSLLSTAESSCRIKRDKTTPRAYAMLAIKILFNAILNVVR